MITQDAFTIYSGLVTTIINKMSGIGKWRTRFIEEIFILFLSIKGRLNFLQLERYGSMNERSYRNQFEERFDFLHFNVELIKTACSTELIHAFDPSFIKKSGKKTPAIGYFFSGSDGCYKRGLEIGCLGVIDVKQNTAYHLDSIQSPLLSKKEKEEKNISLIDHYVTTIGNRKESLLSISNILVVDAFFTKRKFVGGMDDIGLEVISRLRDDANLQYIFKGARKMGKGRPKKFDGKINVTQIDKRRIVKEVEDDELALYSGVVWSVGLKREIKLAYVIFKNCKGKEVTKMYYSTNIKREGKQILKYYRSRFQLEFLFRDSKQFTSLETCQARSENKLNFHFNASMTAVSIAKTIIRKKDGTHDEIVLSISDIKTEFHNRRLAETIFSIYGFNPNLIKNDSRFQQILDYGKIAA